MFSPTIDFALIFLLGACSVGTLLLVAVHPWLAARSAFHRRIEGVAAAGPGLTPLADDGRLRKRSVEQTLREAEANIKIKGKKRAKPSLPVRLRQAGLGWSPRTYYLVSVAAGIVAFLAAEIMLGGLVAAGLGISAGLLLPHWFLGFMRKRRFKRFADEFPNALDVIVRGVKAGLPLVDCLKIVAAEMQEPLKSEFKILLDDLRLGVPLDEAMQRLPERVPLAEANFFAIVIAIQSRTGGSLSGALGNLSTMLRDRQKMRGKVQALSGEVKASAAIIAAMPVAVAAILSVTSPKYIAVLFTTHTGKLVLAGCAVMMMMGVMIMRKMINFEI
jgi:tight adherence protein B